MPLEKGSRYPIGENVSTGCAVSDFPKRNTLCCHRGLQGFSLSFDKERTIQKLYDKTQIVQKLRWLHVVSGFVGEEGMST